MKVHNLTKSVLVALMVASPLVGAETQYPAADFQPEIIKQDAELISKHAEASKLAPASGATKSAPKSETKSGVVASSKKPEEDSNLPLILAAAGAAALAFWFLRKGKSSTTAEVSASTHAPAGATGVARYISNQSGAVGSDATGVARYVASRAESAPAKSQTGVAKYVLSLTATEGTSSPSAKQKTGVEKYVAALPEAVKPAGETGVSKYLKNQGIAA